MAERAITLPMSISPYGTIQSTKLQSKIWADRVLTVIGTAVGERVMRPDFGTDISRTLFNSVDKAESVIKVEVENAFIGFLPTLKLQDVVIKSEPETGTVILDIIYDLPNNNRQNTVVAITAVASKNPPAQENL